MYIAELPKAVQETIEEHLKDLGIYGEDLTLAMDSKTTDIDYLVDVSELWEV